MKKRIILCIVLIVIPALFCSCSKEKEPIDEAAFQELIGQYEEGKINPGIINYIDRDCADDIMSALEDGSYTTGIWYSLTGNTLNTITARYTGCQGVFDLGDNGGDSFTLCFTGDINFEDDDFVMPHAKEKGSPLDCIGDSLLEKMRGADITLANNEFSFSDRGAPLPGKLYTFRANPESVKYFTEMGVDLVSLANNHVYDYGPDAFEDTLSTLDEAGIPHVGAGMNLAEAEAPVCYLINGCKVAFVAATRAEKFIMTPEADASSPGVLRTYDSEEFCRVISEARADNDIVIAYVHWGTEGTTVLEDAQITQAKEYIEAGASAVIGAHPHVVQGLDYYENVPIAYSLGNFWFNKKTLDSCLLTLTFENDNPTPAVRIIPALQSGSETHEVTDETEKRSYFDNMEKISDNHITISDDGTVSH